MISVTHALKSLCGKHYWVHSVALMRTQQTETVINHCLSGPDGFPSTPSDTPPFPGLICICPKACPRAGGRTGARARARMCVCVCVCVSTKLNMRRQFAFCFPCGARVRGRAWLHVGEQQNSDSHSGREMLE